MTVLFIFVKHYTKSQLQQMIPGLTIWWIRKHAAVVGAGDCRKSGNLWFTTGSTAKNLITFWNSPVAPIIFKMWCTAPKSYKCQLVRCYRSQRWCALCFRMVALYQNYCCKMEFEPLARSTLFAVLKVSNPVQSACFLYTF